MSRVTQGYIQLDKNKRFESYKIALTLGLGNLSGALTFSYLCVCKSKQVMARNVAKYIFLSSQCDGWLQFLERLW